MWYWYVIEIFPSLNSLSQQMNRLHKRPQGYKKGHDPTSQFNEYAAQNSINSPPLVHPTHSHYTFSSLDPLNGVETHNIVN